MALFHCQEPRHSQIPGPTTARQELPNEAALQEAGIALGLIEARLVLTVLSLVIATGCSRTRDKVHQMILGLVAACTLEREYNGIRQPAAHPELPRKGWPSGRTALRQLGIDAQAIAVYWPSSRRRADDACLPLRWVLAFCPAQLWPAVMTFIRWGPARAGVMMEDATIVLAQTRISCGTRRRPAGSRLAFGTIKTRVNAVWQLMAQLIALRERLRATTAPLLPLELLEGWTHTPPRPDLRECGAVRARLDTSGPPLDECAMRLRELAADAEAHPRRLFRWRRLLVLALLCLYGIRVDALRRLEIADYIPSFVFHDGIRGPALRLYPGKTREPDEPYCLPVPQKLASWLEHWIALLGHELGTPGFPMFPGTRPSRRAPAGGFLDATGMYTFIAGKPNGAGSGSRALLPKNGDPFIGWHPHAFRHTAYVAARRAAKTVKAASPEMHERDDAPDFARAVVGHALVRTPDDVYRDLDQHRLARAAIEEAWRHLWGGGTRRGPDVEAVWSTRTRVEELTAELEAQMSELRLLEDQQQRLLKQSMRTQGEALYQLTFRSHAVQVKSQRISHEIVDIRKQIEAAHAAYGRVLTEEVPLPSDQSEDEYEAALRLALGENTALGDEPALAEELTVSDVAELFGVTVQAVNRWHHQGPPRLRPEPWHTDDNPWRIYHARHKRLQARAINEAALTASQQIRLKEIRRRRAVVDKAREGLLRGQVAN